MSVLLVLVLFIRVSKCCELRFGVLKLVLIMECVDFWVRLCSIRLVVVL